MTDASTPWPLDDPEHLADALREQLPLAMIPRPRARPRGWQRT